MEEENSRKRIGRRIRELRMTKGLTKQTLARLTDVSAASITRLETGRHSIGIDALAKIAIALDATVEIVEDGKLRIEDRIWSSDRERILIQLRNIRIEKNFRQHRLADLLGIACCNLSLIEAAKRSTGSEIIAIMASLLSCRLEIVTRQERHTMEIKKIKDCKELSSEEIEFLKQNHKQPIAFLQEKLERSEIDIKSNLQKLRSQLKEEKNEQVFQWTEKQVGFTSKL
jgi:transcriptional regulator with XRE-family HTH domain